MAASFRNLGQIHALAGCDLLTIAPELLAQLQAAEGSFDPPSFEVDDASPSACGRDEAAFRFDLNEDAMASEKLAEGVRLFAADARRLDALLAKA
jgi:transaldolase